MFLLQASNSILHQLERWDQWLFVRINQDQANPFFDSLMPYLRNSFYWAPLYLFLLLVAVINFKGRGWWWVLLFLCTVSLTDMISSKLIKEAFERLRPCQDPAFSDQVRLLVNRCSGAYSFTSSHAANHFGMATFFFLTTKPLIKNRVLLAWVWAALISYAQVYVGVHYPFDVLGGAIIGASMGWMTGRFFNKRFGIAIFEK
jgi:membrane-associated phospholipid phosphatase